MKSIMLMLFLFLSIVFGTAFFLSVREDFAVLQKSLDYQAYTKEVKE